MRFIDLLYDTWNKPEQASQWLLKMAQIEDFKE